MVMVAIPTCMCQYNRIVDWWNMNIMVLKFLVLAIETVDFSPEGSVQLK